MQSTEIVVGPCFFPGQLGNLNFASLILPGRFFVGENQPTVFSLSLSLPAKEAKCNKSRLYTFITPKCIQFFQEVLTTKIAYS